MTALLVALVAAGAWLIALAEALRLLAELAAELLVPAGPELPLAWARRRRP